MSNPAENGDVTEPRRITVTVDVNSHLPSILELAAALAVAQRAALHGLFVEDLDLLNVAGLPFSQEVPLLCGQPRSLDDRKLERSLSRAGGIFRRHLEQEAQRASLQWSFRTVRGRKHALDLDDEAADILVLAQRAPLRRSRRGPLRLLLLPDHSQLALPALKVLLEHNRGHDIELLLVGEDPDPQAQAALQELLGEQPGVRLRRLQQPALDALLEDRDSGPDCVVLARHAPAARLRQVLSLAQCPILVVS